jgi:hypothetical protein
VRALTKLEIAELRHELESIPALQKVVGETCRARMKAVESLQEHEKTHRAAASGA